MPPKQLRFSRWRRLTGAHRIGDRKITGPDDEPQRLTLYLSGRDLDRAEALANRAGVASVQSYCEGLLRGAIAGEYARHRLAESEATRGVLQSLDDLESDPEYLAEWSASIAGRESAQAAPLEGPEPDPVPPVEGQDEALLLLPEPTDPETAPVPPTEVPMPRSATAIVLRHAALEGDDPSGLLATLRRGEPIEPDAARDLLQALLDLERAHRGVPTIDRRLAFALHRIAFEGQLLLTEAWPALVADPATVDTLRLLQEAVDRVLSGEDIRYYREGQAPACESS